MKRSYLAGLLALLLVPSEALLAEPDEIWVDGRPVETKADGPCVSALTTGSQRYADCGNGTVYDTATGLLWLKDAACDDLGLFGIGTWFAARIGVLELQHGLCGLSDHSQPGDWRLPTVDEWVDTISSALLHDCFFGGAGGPPSLTSDSGTECIGTGASSFVGVSASPFWASGTSLAFPTEAWHVDLFLGIIAAADKNGAVLGPLGIWPVRKGGGPGPPGAVEAGGAVVETKTKTSCLAGATDGDQRYVDCGDGTFMDLSTALVWLTDASCADLPGTDVQGRADWPGSMAAATALSDGMCGLSDGSQPGDWRLATIDEWSVTMDRAKTLGCTLAGAGEPPALTDATGLLCAADGTAPFVGTEDHYWTGQASILDLAGLSLLISGSIAGVPKSDLAFVWPVRQGE